jgi:translation initiation factor IF-2|tara:strand:- start:294 stop:527 length:234 start_codon:yes stop_codon:yes gene_type:complete
MSEDTTVEAQVAETPETSEAQGPDLTVQDLQALKSIIDVASQRGAFKPNEMMTVGQTYSKLETFLNAVSQQQPAQGA